MPSIPTGFPIVKTAGGTLALMASRLGWILCFSCWGTGSDIGGPLLVGSWLSSTYTVYTKLLTLTFIYLLFLLACSTRITFFTSFAEICTGFQPSIHLTCSTTTPDGRHHADNILIISEHGSSVNNKFLIRMVKNAGAFHNRSHKNGGEQCFCRWLCVLERCWCLN